MAYPVAVAEAKKLIDTFLESGEVQSYSQNKNFNSWYSRLIISSQDNALLVWLSYPKGIGQARDHLTVTKNDRGMAKALKSNEARCCIQEHSTCL